VTQVVESDSRQRRPLDRLRELAGETLRMDWAAVRHREDKAVVAVALADQKPLRQLGGPVNSQLGHRAGVHADETPTAVGLRVGPDGLAGFDVDESPTHGERGRVEVDHLPGRPEDLATAHAGHGQNVPRGVVPLVRRPLEEPRELGGGPGMDLPELPCFGRRVRGLGPVRGVALQEVSLQSCLQARA